MDHTKITPLDIQNPWQGFQDWWSQAQTLGLKNFNAVSLSTVDLQGKITIRTVLLKKFSKQQGFVFYTNVDSRKGKALQENPLAAILCYWDEMQKQIKIEGNCSFLSAEDSLAYFHTRQRQSQIAAHASHQSKELLNRKELLDKYHLFEKKYQNMVKIPLPDYWRGVVLQPKELEFWQGGDFRLHHRLRFFFKDNYSWHSKILAP